MCRICRYIDPDPSFVFIGPPPSTRPVADGRRLARPPLPAIRDLDRAPPPPPPQALGRHLPPQRPAAPPPLATGRRSAGPASRCGGGGAAGHPPSWHQLGEKRKCWLWGLKNRPLKIDESSIFAPKGAPFIFGQVLKKSQRSNEYFERYSQKIWGESRICPPPLSSARVNLIIHRLVTKHGSRFFLLGTMKISAFHWKGKRRSLGMQSAQLKEQLLLQLTWNQKPWISQFSNTLPNVRTLPTLQRELTESTQQTVSVVRR